MYKKALHSFFLKVHPDFFTAHPTQQRANEASIAQLNELLGWAKEFKAGVCRPPPSTRVSLTFYQQRPAPASDRTAKVDDPSLTLIQASFELPSAFAPTDSNRGVAERSINKFLRELLRKADCIDGAAESISEAEDVAKEKEEVRPLRRKHIIKKKNANNVKQAKSLLDEAAEAMSSQWSLTAVPTMEELMEADQILFSRELSPLQSAAALNMIQNHIGEMMYERWQSMPLLITTKFAVGEISGTISVPWDFQLSQFYSFLHNHDKAIQESRGQVESFARKLEVLITELCNDLQLDDVLVSCPHKSAYPCLLLLHRNRDLLLQAHVTKTTLEIGNRFATRANGVVIVPCDMTHAKLEAWSRVIVKKMPLQQRLYQLSKQMLEETMWHLKEFRTIVEPRGIDAFENDLTYAQRLAWAKEMFRIASSLAQWDWTEFTFAIGPLDLNWENKMMTLPHDFDGSSLLRYIESVHQDAKKKKRDELLQESAMAKSDEEKLALEHKNPTAFQEELEKEFPEGRTANDSSPPTTVTGAPLSPSATIADSLRKYHSGSNKKSKIDERKDELRKASPHLEEYMASSSHSIDALPVERPLHHSVAFASEDEATDNLKWEGFYDDPYVDQRPLSAVDDLEHAYFATNRWHREKAAQEVLEQLQGTYGSKKKLYDYVKMGDLMGINDPKIMPKGFPIMAKGIKPGV